jgi:predicted RNA-binding Zn-ribbon protein involved in translation (DUF1610 family)
MTRNEYDLNPKLCLHCGTAIPFEKRANKFCNSSCSATFNNTGKKHSEEHKAAISERMRGEKNPFYGKTHTDEFRKRQSEYASKRVGQDSNAYGMKHTKETKRMLSEMNKGKPRAKPHEKVLCPWCGKEGIKPNMKRWHFDNCKVALCP